MKKEHLKILFILFAVISSFLLYRIFLLSGHDSTQAMYLEAADLSSTKDWQDTALLFINKRNEIINRMINGAYKNNRNWESELKSLECSPLLDGDIGLGEYIIKNPGQFNNKTGYINIEYSEIRKLTNEEVIILSKVIYEKNGVPVRCDMEISFKNNNGKWLLSKLAFAK